MFKRTMIPDYACSRRTNHHPTQRTRRVQTICPYLLERWGASGQPPAASMDANLGLSRYPAIELRHYCGALGRGGNGLGDSRATVRWIIPTPCVDCLLGC